MRATRQKITEEAKMQRLDDMAEEYHGRKIPVHTDKNKPSKYVFCPDIGYTSLQNLKFGRFAFGGMNPEIEKIQAEEELKRQRRSNPHFVEAQEDVDVSATEMAKSTFSTTKQRNGRGVFIEPADKVLNIYTEETNEPLATDTSSSASNGQPHSQRFAPYRHGNGQQRGKQKKPYGNKKTH